MGLSVYNVGKVNAARVTNGNTANNEQADAGCPAEREDITVNDELTRLGISQKTARSMGHLPIGGADGSLEQLATLPIERIIYIHINNTNPILIDNSPQRHAVEARGLAVAFDGMEMEI